MVDSRRYWRRFARDGA